MFYSSSKKKNNCGPTDYNMETNFQHTSNYKTSDGTEKGSEQNMQYSHPDNVLIEETTYQRTKRLINKHKLSSLKTETPLRHPYLHGQSPTIPNLDLSSIKLTTNQGTRTHKTTATTNTPTIYRWSQHSTGTVAETHY